MTVPAPDATDTLLVTMLKIVLTTEVDSLGTDDGGESWILGGNLKS